MTLAESLAIGAPEVVLALGSMVLLMLGVFRQGDSLRLLSWGAVLVFFLAGLTVIDDTPERMLAWNDFYVADSLSAYLKILILVGAVVSVLMAIPYLERTRGSRFEFPVLIVLATMGMFVLVSANNLLSLYLGLELMSLSSYVLASFNREEERSSEAGLKYFVLGALASGLLLYGVSLVYGFVGSIDFSTIATGLAVEGTRNIGAIFGVVFIIAGIAFKASAAPFHMWTPDVYEGAPTPVTAYFAAAPKVAALGLLLRLALDAFQGIVADWQQIIIFMSVASMLIGAVGAIAQKNIKRLLAYSAINSVGFMLIGLAAATEAGVSAVLLYLAIYVVMELGAFLVVLAMRDADGRAVETISDMAGMARTRPWLSAALAIFMFSLAGLPPLFGFVAKLVVFNAAIDEGLYLLAVFGVLMSVVGAYYYLQVVKIMFFDQPADVVVVGDQNILNNSMTAVAAIFCSPLGYLLLNPLTAATRAAAGSLF